ncbi:MAG TPA: hypothetical protein VGO92_09840 [Acidimicrobiales bacterium]|nr:hypothetical protein [Acidimicrobiales bacterium]
MGRGRGRGGPGGDAEPGSHGPGGAGGNGGGDEAAELVWRAGEDVDPPVTVVVDGREYEAGAGPPEGRVEMTEDELRRAVEEAEAGTNRDWRT